MRAMVSRSQCLCRLCEFPAADGGVPLEALDADKLAEWCRRELGEELHISSDAEQISVICQFCIWEARLVHESLSPDDNEIDWWTGHDDDRFFREYFYKTSFIQPCKIVLEKIPSEFDHLETTNIAANANHHCNVRLQQNFEGINSPKLELNHSIKEADRKIKCFQCTRCHETMNYYHDLKYHMKKIHKAFVRCRSYMCATYFVTENEREEHENKFHLNDGALDKRVKCSFCSALITSGAVNLHFRMKHKEAIKCDYKKGCLNFFHTVSEKNDHIFNEHTKGLELKMTPVKCIYCDKICKNISFLLEHVNIFHEEVRIKCKVKGCVVYFLSQEDREDHFLQVHQHAENLKKWQCPKCSYKCKDKWKLRNHLQSVHLNKACTFQCPQCPKSFHAKYNLKNHLKRSHSQSEQCICQYCGKAIRRVSMLKHFSSGACKNDELTSRAGKI